MALPRLPGGSAKPRIPIIDNSGAALERRIRTPPPAPPKPRPIAHTASRPVGRIQTAPRPSPAPKPPPVVVPNNTGNYSKPKPPPSPTPGPIKGAGGGKGGIQGGKGKGKPTPLPLQPSPVAPPTPIAEDIPPPPPPPGIDEYLGLDELYQGTLGGFGNELSGYDAEATSRRSQNATSFAQRLRQLQEAQEADEMDMREDFGARGILDSDVFAKSLTGLQGQYGQSRTGLNTEYAGFENELVTGRSDLLAAQEAAKQEAMAAAIARRAAQYGL